MMSNKFYSTKEVLKRVAISRNTLFLWFKYHKIPEAQRDRNGHRVFTDKEIELILAYKNKLIPPKKGTSWQR